VQLSNQDPPDDPDLASLRDLAAAGQAQPALDIALIAADLDQRVQGLCRIAEGLAGVADPSYNPLAFYQPW
jgi:hypothetical protein